MKIFLFMLVFVSAFLYRCDYEDNDTYTTPCKGKFGSQKVFDSVAKIFNLRDDIFFFRETYKNYDGPPLSCDTINLSISDYNNPVITTDTFLRSLSSIFFNDTANVNVKYLKIEAIDTWPAIGSLEAIYLLDKNSSNNYLSSNPHIDINYSIAFTIIKEIPFVKASAIETTKGLRVNVNVPTESNDIKKLADELKEKYSKVISEKSLDEFEIDFTIERPNNKYCISKVNHFFYCKRNKNL